MQVEINCDMGEAFGIYRLGDDARLMPVVDVANLACGFHAADPTVMRKTVTLAKRHGVKIGAHPSLPDLQGFGRREMQVTREELRDIFLYQIGALTAFLRAEGLELNHIKPHGCINAMSGRNADFAHGICDAAEVYDVPVYGLPNTLHERVYPERNIRWVPEFYADLEYGADGSLIVTREHVAVEPEAAAERCLRALRENRVQCVDGGDIQIRAGSVCVHSDTPGAVEIIRAIRRVVGYAEA